MRRRESGREHDRGRKWEGESLKKGRREERERKREKNV